MATNKILGGFVIISYPNFSEEPIIFMDANKMQIGGVFSQNGKPIDFKLRKINHSKINYTTIEIEMLIIVEYIKLFCTILLGHCITIYMKKG